MQTKWNSDTISSNFRLRWEYTPGSELFVVYSEDRDTDPLMPDRFSELQSTHASIARAVTVSS